MVKTLTKADLLELLADVHDDAPIVLAKSPGADNGYTPLADVRTNAVYVPGSSYCGEAYAGDSSADDNLLEEEDWQQLMQGKRAVVLYGVH